MVRAGADVAPIFPDRFKQFVDSGAHVVVWSFQIIELIHTPNQRKAAADLLLELPRFLISADTRGSESLGNIGTIRHNVLLYTVGAPARVVGNQKTGVVQGVMDFAVVR